MGRASGRSSGLAVAAALLIVLAGCTSPADRAAVVTPTATVSVTANPTTSGTVSPGTPTSDEATKPPSTSTATTAKPEPKPPAATITKAEAAAALKKAVNATIDAESDPRAKVTSVDVRVLAKDANGTWWAGGYLANDLDGGIVFAKMKAGGSWVVVDLGTGIDGSEMVGKAPASIAAQFQAEFTP